MRARRLWLALALLAAAGVAGGCRGDSPGTSLTLVARNPSVGQATFLLECEPPAGDVPEAAAVCRRIAARPEVLLHPTPFTCFGGTFSWWEIRITGRYDGDPVDVKTSTCWTPQMELIRVLGIARELERHIDPLSRPAYPGSGIPRSALADVVEIPEDAPGWLIRIARLQARRLGDKRPDRLRIVLGDPHVITLEGEFVCTSCSHPPGARPPRGSVATVAVDARTRIVDSFSLRREVG